MPYSLAMTTGHLKHQYKCPFCRSVFKGNGYFSHRKACAKRHASTALFNDRAESWPRK